jgi:hypothetical protein
MILVPFEPEVRDRRTVCANFGFGALVWLWFGSPHFGLCRENDAGFWTATLAWLRVSGTSPTN